MQLDMTRGSIPSLLIRFTIPLLIGNLFQQLYNMVDTMIVGKYVGASALAAVGATGNLMFLITGFSIGFAAGFSIITAQAFGAGDGWKLRHSVSNGILLSLLTAVILTTVSLTCMDTFLHWMNTPSDIYPQARSYITIIAAGLIANTFYNLLSGYLRAVGNSRAPLMFLIFSSVLNILLDLWFILSFHMGVKGAAMATVLSQAVSAVLCAVYIHFRVPDLIPRRNEWRLQRAISLSQLKMGIPMALQFAVTASGMTIMQAAINAYGSTAVAAVTAASKLQYLLMQGVMATGQAMATFCGQNFGAGDRGRVTQGIRVALAGLAAYSIFAFIMLRFVFPHLLFLFFPGSEDLTSIGEYAGSYFRVTMCFYLPLSFILIFRNSLQGCGYALLPLFSGITELLARCIMAALSGHTHRFLFAIACDPAAWCAAGLYTLLAYLFVRHQWKRQGVLDQ